MNPRGSVLVVSMTLFAIAVGWFAIAPLFAQGKSAVITAKCPKEEGGKGPFNFHMSPWEIEVLQGEPTEWILNTNSADTKIVMLYS